MSLSSTRGFALKKTCLHCVNRLLNEMFTWKMKNSRVLLQPLLLSSDRKRQILDLCLCPHPSSRESEVLMLLFVWKLEARETGVLSDVLLAHGFVLYSSSHSGSLASGAVWLSSTLRRYWCLAMKYCMCWDVVKAPAAHRHLKTVIILGYAHRHVCYFLVQWRVFGICASASCLSVAVYLILVFFSSVVGNLKPPNGIFQSPLPNCSDTLMR